MITFFRKLRQQLLTQNKFSRYLLYAIGEIILVVIGILIALQINNWNEHQKLQEQEKKLLLSLQKEMQENIAILEDKVHYNEVSMASMDRFITLAYKERLTEYNYTSNIRIFDYNPAIVESPILDDILESNSRALLSNSELLQKLRALKANYKAIEKGEYYLDEFWNNKITDYLISAGTGYVIFSGMEADNIPDDIPTQKVLKIDDQFLSLIVVKKGLQRVWLSSQKNALERSKKVIQQLENM